MHRALEVAAWFLNRIDREAGDSVTNLKLQKLIYYAQAWSVALTGQPLFEEDVEAWSHGPVVDTVYQEFKSFEFQALPKARKWGAEFTPQERSLLEDVLAVYGEHSAKFLEDLTHGEQPWRDTRGDLPPGRRSRRTISLESMRTFYREQYKKRQERTMKIDLSQLRPELLEEGIIALSELPDAHFPADHEDFQRAVHRDLAARPRRVRRGARAQA